MTIIPTAEELVLLRVGTRSKWVVELMTEFAKLHVEAALKGALESIPCLGSSTDIATSEEVENAVLNSYPLKNIK